MKWTSLTLIPSYEEDHQESHVSQAGVTSDLAMVLEPGDALY